MARKRTGITIHQMAKNCAIKESKKISLSEFSQIIRRKLDMDLGISTLSEILKNKEKWENCESSNGWKIGRNWPRSYIQYGWNWAFFKHFLQERFNQEKEKE